MHRKFGNPDCKKYYKKKEILLYKNVASGVGRVNEEGISRYEETFSP